MDFISSIVVIQKIKKIFSYYELAKNIIALQLSAKINVVLLLYVCVFQLLFHLKPSFNVLF